ncbi:DUF3853 family protein [Spirosoma areae]
MSYPNNPFTSIEERLERIEFLLLGKLTGGTLASSVNNCAKQHIYGIDGLARLLNCSKPTAQRIKDSGKIPFTQVGRKIVFDQDQVLSALGKGGVAA